MKFPRIRLRYIYLQNRLGFLWPFIMGGIFMLTIFIAAVMIYMHVEGWGFVDSMYMTVITLSSVGFQEVHPLSQTGRLFTSLLILFGVGGFMFMAGSGVQMLVDGKLHRMLGRRRVQKSIDGLRDHFIVCGFGRIGGVVTRQIIAEGHPVVVVENDPSLLTQLEEANHLFIHGDATSDEVLNAAGIQRARAVIATLSQDAHNVYVTLTAKQMNPKLKIIARAGSEASISRLERAGADRVVLPHKIGGIRMAQSILRPAVVSFLDLTANTKVDLQMEEILVKPASSLAGKDLIESEIRPKFNVMIIIIRSGDGEVHFNPSPDYVIKPWDTLVAVGGTENLARLRQSL